jgi:hypothetical protein
MATLRDLPRLLETCVNNAGIGVQAEFTAQWGMEAIQGSPHLTGLFMDSWSVSVGAPAYRGLSGPASVMTRANFDAALRQLNGRNSSFLNNDATNPRSRTGNAYAAIIDRGRMQNMTRPRMGGSHQARLGVSGPAAIRAQMATEAAAGRIYARVSRMRIA